MNAQSIIDTRVALQTIQNFYQCPEHTDLLKESSSKWEYEFQPYNFLMTDSLRIDSQIKRELDKAVNSNQKIVDSGFLKAINAYYFNIDGVIYLQCMDFGLFEDGLIQKRSLTPIPLRQIELEEKILTVQLCEPLESMVKDFKGAKMLLVATLSEIRALKILRVDNDIQISDCGQKILTDGQVTQITQFKKNNRIFYGGKQVNITELKLSDNIYDRLKEFFNNGPKKLRKEQHMDSVFSKMIPEFFKFGDRKEV